MKSIFIIVVGLVCVFCGCQTKVQNLNVKHEQLKFNSTDYEIQIGYPIFSCDDKATDASCCEFNDKIKKFVTELSDNLKEEAVELFQTFADKPAERPVWKYELMIDDSVFMADNKFVSVRLSVYAFTGGAHGYTSVHSFNYDVKNQKFLTKEDILNYTNDDQITSKLKACFKNPDGCFIKEPTLDLVNAINFDATSVYFMYEQYVLGPHSCGAAEIVVPRKVLQENILIKLD